MRFVFKGDPDIIPQLEEAGLGPFEVYIRDSRDLARNFDNVIAIHFHYKLDDGRKINLADEGELGDKSEEMLLRAVQSAKRNGIKKVVFHPPYVNLSKISKERAIAIMARRLERIHDPEVLLCIENVGLWITQAYTDEPIFVNPEDYFSIKKEVKIPLGLVFDVEHYCITSVMNLFYDKYKQPLLDVSNGVRLYQSVEQEFEKELEEYTNNNELHQHCHSFVENALEKLKEHINHFHICGSDFNKYFVNPIRSSLLGEHLPIKFTGRTYGHEVKDQLDHSLWVKQLKDTELDVVMEISPKEGHEFIELLRSGKNHLESLK